MFKPLFALALIGTLCGGFLAGTYYMTKPDIEKNRQARAVALMDEMLNRPQATKLRPLDPIASNTTISTSGDCAHYLFHRFRTAGYAGPIEFLALWQPPTPTVSLRILSHRETPGIGDFIDQNRSDWLTLKDHGNSNSFANIDNVSGATLTTTAIVQAAANVFTHSEVYCANQ